MYVSDNVPIKSLRQPNNQASELILTDDCRILLSWTATTVYSATWIIVYTCTYTDARARMRKYLDVTQNLVCFRTPPLMSRFSIVIWLYTKFQRIMKGRLKLTKSVL